MADTLAALEAHGELGKVADRLTDQVRAEPLAMSAATIDRYLAPTRARRYPAAQAATRPSATLRSELTVRRATDELEARPGFFEIDLVAHCGHTLTRSTPGPRPRPTCSSAGPATSRSRTA